MKENGVNDASTVPQAASQFGKHIPGHGRIEWLILLGLIAAYLFISLHNLDTLPPVYEDEPWLASVAWKLARQGIMGSDMFAGFYGMEQNYYGFMPLYQLLTAAILRLTGLGLAQVRLTSVLMGMLILLLTYSLGRRLFNAQVGILAVVFLLFVRTSSTSIYDLSGIPLLDIARIHRYDIAVPVFGLAALHVYLSARIQNRWIVYLIAGLLAGLSGLMHLYGIFWLAAILLLALIDRVTWKDLFALVVGFCLPWIPYLLYIASNIPDWRGQTQFHTERFGLLDPIWYWRNLTREYQRYSLGLLPLGRSAWFRIGTWTSLLAVTISLIGLGWHALYRRDRAARSLFVPAVLLPVLFALLITVKYRHYGITLLPLLSLAAAWGCLYLWKAARRRVILRIILLLLLAAVMAEGTSRMVVLEAAARETTPYHAYISTVRAQLPAEARVLGLQRYWIGLHDLEYQSWLVPIYQTHDIYQPLPIEEALERIDPQVILIDPAMRAYFSNPSAGDDLPERILAWMKHQGYTLTISIDDGTYGKMEGYIHDIYYVRKAKIWYTICDEHYNQPQISKRTNCLPK